MAEEKIAVYCATEIEWASVKIKANLPGVATWNDVSHYGDICIYLDRHNSFDRRADCLKNGYKVLTADGYLYPKKKKAYQDRAVLCETGTEWNAVIKKAKKTGIPAWHKLNNYSQKCIYIDASDGFDEKPDCVKRGSTIITAKKYLAPERKLKPRGTLGINFNSIVSNISTKEVTDESMWKPIDTAPKDKFILIKLDSGYMSYPVDAMIAQYSTAYDRWRTVQNDSVTDSHECPPLGWMEVPE